MIRDHFLAQLKDRTLCYQFPLLNEVEEEANMIAITCNGISCCVLKFKEDMQV